METVTIETLIGRAYNIFSDTSIFEVLDMEPEPAKQKLMKLYRKTDNQEIGNYLDILNQLRQIIDPNQCTH